MKLHRFCLMVCLVFGWFLTSCKSPPSKPRVETSATEATRNNCYSLLHQVFDEEKDVSMLRFIKHENADLKNLINKVAAAAGSGASQLEKFAKEDPSLVLDDYRLPPGEDKTRDSISAMEQKELLHDSDDKFEVTLILSQIEALNYASRLAKVAGENDFKPERARYLAGLSTAMKSLHDQAIARLTLRQWSPTASQ